MIDRDPSQPQSWQISGQCVRQGDLQDSQWMTIEGQTSTQSGQKSRRRAGKLRQTTVRSQRRHGMKQVPSCCDWLSVNHLGFFLTHPPHPPFTFQERKIKNKKGKKNTQQKEKLWIEIPLRLGMPKPLFLWFVLDIGWQHVGVRSVQS